MEAPVEVFSHIPHFGDAVLAIVQGNSTNRYALFHLLSLWMI